jgi:signal transduction histidine kinase
MFKFNRLGIGVKITAGLLLFLFILAVSTSWLVDRGFKLAEQTAVQRSAESLQNLTQESLVQQTSLEAQLYDADLQKAASLAQIAADFMVRSHQFGKSIDWEEDSTRVVWSGSQLTLSPDGLLYYDNDPDRITEILQPGNIAPDIFTDQSLRDSAILDTLFPSLLAETDTAVGIYFQGPQLTMRYYPVRDLANLEIKNGAASAAQSIHIEDFPVAPKNNPERKTIWLPPYVDDAGQGLLVSANTPIYYVDQFQGYIGIDISLNRLVERLNSLKPTPGSFAFLMDSKGKLIAVPAESAVILAGRNLSAQESSLTGLLGLPLGEINSSLTPVLSEAQIANIGATQLSLDGTMMLVTYAPLPEMGWDLSIVVPLSEATIESLVVSEAIRSHEIITIRNTFLAMGALFLVAAFISLLLSYLFINRPLRQVLQGVRTITSGDLGVSVPVNSEDELGELAESFNQMAGELNRRTQQLSQTSTELEIKKAQLRVATLEERQRLARELHDSVSKALYGIALGVRTARTQLDRDPSKVGEPLEYALSQAEVGLSEMRALIFELRPESLQTEGLVTALTKQSDALRARYKLEVITAFCAEPDISLDEKEMLYRVAQEAMHNIAKHAGATTVTLGLKNEDNQLTLEIHDNGKGFDPDEEFPGHLGLRSMRERVAVLGGALQIVSDPGKGTTVIVTLM